MIKFDFSQVPTTTKEYEAAVLATSGGKFFQEGTVDVQILAVEERGPATDPTWQKYMLTLGQGEKQIKDTILVPFKSYLYQAPGKPSNTFLFKKLAKFIEGLNGQELKGSQSSMSTILPPLFSDPQALVGQTLSIQVGYQGHHAKRDEGGQYRVFDKLNVPLKDETGIIPVFADFKSAQAGAAEYGINVRGLAVLEYLPKKAVAEDKWGE